MLEAFYLNTFFLFVQILISLFLIWLCDREDEDDDENDDNDDNDRSSGGTDDIMLAAVIYSLLN